MKLEDFLNKTVILELRDSSIVKGMRLDRKDIDDDYEEIHETRLSLRIKDNEYRIIDINEILTIGEIN